MKAIKQEIRELKYHGFFNSVNPKPQGNYILVFISDWNKDYWAFYAYISQANWEDDIKQINDLITKMNWRDGDVYVELIDFHDDTMRKFYMIMYDESAWTHWNALDLETWKKYCPRLTK